MNRFTTTCLIALAASVAVGAAHAQPKPPTPPQAPASAPPAKADAGWDKLPRLDLQGIFAGPLRDTIVQRWHDPATGAICYIYLPITAPHSQPTPNGYVQYGSSTVGSISCVPGPVAQGKGR